MHRHRFKIVIAFCCMLAMFSSCHQVPKNARYIPKDAVIVLGVNTRQMTHKIAWSVLTSSKLFQQMRQHMSDTGTAGLEQMGIDLNSTMYLYAKNDTRFTNSSRVTVLVPLSDDGKWEAYVKKQFPQVNIQQQKDIKVAALTSQMYAGWNKDLLIVTNGWGSPERYMQMNTMGGDTTAPAPANDAADATAQIAAITEDFNIPEDNQITKIKHFKELEEGGHDVSLWLNTQQMMTQYMQKSMASQMGGLSLTSDLWKDAATAGYVDFEKGRIKGETISYVSDEMAGIYKDLASSNADEDMINRLPVQNLDLLLTGHLGTKGFKELLEKMNVLGLANLALAQQGMNADYILDAFTGDIAVVVDNFTMTKKTATDSSAVRFTDSTAGTSASYTPSADYMYVMKINKKENFRKLLQMITSNGMQSIDNNTYYAPISATDSLFLMTDDTYVVVTNRSAGGKGFLAGSFKSGTKLPEDAHAHGHPFAMYVDMQQFTNTLNFSMFSQDAHMLSVFNSAKDLINNIAAESDAFSGKSSASHFVINFKNKDENSLMQLIEFGIKVQDATANNNATAQANP